MLVTILNYLPALGIAVLVNIALGLYYNVEKIGNIFSVKTLLIGLVKALIIVSAFCGLSYCFDITGAVIDFGVFELTPEAIMIAALILYMSKGCTNLAKILGVEKATKVESGE